MSNSEYIEIHTLKELYAKELPELRWVVYDLIPEGLFLLAGESKGGKSVLSANLALAISKGNLALGRYYVEKGGVLYLDLESTERRLKDKIVPMITDNILPDNFYYRLDFPSMDKGGLELLDKLLQEHSEIKLVIIDTFAKFRGENRRGGNAYYNDYDILTPIKNLADKHSIAIILIHHTNKLKETENVYNRISGSEGMKAVPDTIGVFIPPPPGGIQARFLLKGRDIEEKKITLHKKEEVKAWIAVEDEESNTTAVATTKQRKAILSALENRRLMPHEIAEAINKTSGSVRVLLMKLVEQKLVIRDEAGFYYLPEK